MQSDSVDPLGKPKCGQHKVKFTYEDDQRLAKYVETVGEGDWGKIAELMGDRNGRQCRERWNNYLNPVLRKDAWTAEEVSLLIEKYKELGPRWNRIAKCFDNRSTNNVKNKWMTLKRREEKNRGVTFPTIAKSLPVPEFRPICTPVMPTFTADQKDVPQKPIRIPFPPLLPTIGKIDSLLNFEFPKLSTRLRI